ncbi:MAG: hypothetical protein JNK15_18655 [Planctomycetes bacterium]|nr:hypothetical protein [Planctomycetota bacterium]
MMARLGSLLGFVLLAACAAVRPADVPTVASAVLVADAARTWPGAGAVLAGFDTRGEGALRHGDRVLYGIELARGDAFERRLLLVEVVRDGFPMQRLGSVWFKAPAAAPGTFVAPERRIRGVELALTMFDEHGRELQRSRGGQVPDWVLEAGFVDDIRAVRAGDAATDAIASVRLLWVVQMLQDDAILNGLLRQVASVPLDPRLLFRRELRLAPGFARGREVATVDGMAALGSPFELPFDMFLNDSLFVRLSATVVPPRGATGVAAGIIGLLAQQATDPGRRLTLQLLACARGPQSEWQRHGMLVLCGTVDEGAALAFAPDGGRMVMPGRIGAVELRDLRSPDPTVATELTGGSHPVADLAFIDSDTVLVARGPALEMFVVRDAVPGRPLAPVATFPLPRRPVALLAVGNGQAFVGCVGGEVQRWSFATGPEAPVREVVRPPLVLSATFGGAPTAPVALDPGRAFLAAAEDAEGVEVRWFAETACYRRCTDGSWRKTAIPAAPVSAPPVRVSKNGERVERSDGLHVFAGQTLQITWPAGKGLHAVGIPMGDHDDPAATAHGFDPTGRFYAHVGPGLRLLCDVERVRASVTNGAAAR